MPIKYRDIEKEKQLLAILLKGRRFNRVEVLNRLNPSSFTTHASQELFKLIRDYNARYFAPINPQIGVNLADNLDTAVKRKVINLIKGVAKIKINAKTVFYLVEELTFHEASRDMQKMLLTAKDIFKQQGNPFMVKDFLFDAITQHQIKTGAEVEFMDVRRSFKERYKLIKAIKKSGVVRRGIDSGIDERFDDEISGYNPGDLIVFVSQTAGGKSICMQDQAVFMAIEQNKKIAYITNEMTPSQVAFRMDSRISEIRHRKFKKPILMRKIDFEKWKVTMKQLKKGQLAILGMTGGNCSAAAIDQKLREKGFKPDAIFIDYVNNMVPNRMPQGASSLTLDWQPQGQILVECKNLGLKRKVPTITAGQLKPDAYDKEEIVAGDIAINKQALLTNADVLVAIIQTRAMKLRQPPRAKIQFLKVREGKEREWIEILPNFNIIRIHDPRIKRKNKKRKKKKRNKRE